MKFYSAQIDEVTHSESVSPDQKKAGKSSAPVDWLMERMEESNFKWDNTHTISDTKYWAGKSPNIVKYKHNPTK